MPSVTQLSTTIDGPRFEKILKLAEPFKRMNALQSTYSGIVMCLTSVTSNALNITLTEIVSLIELLLSYGFKYAFLGKL